MPSLKKVISNFFWASVIGGVGATLAMTLFTEVAFRMLRRPYRVIRILANMMQFQKTTSIHARPQPELLVACVVHFFIGVIFAFGYYSLVPWVSDWSPSIRALSYGVFIGLMAVGGWRLFFDLHPGPPAVYLPEYLAIIAIGHLVLAFTLAGIDYVG